MPTNANVTPLALPANANANAADNANANVTFPISISNSSRLGLVSKAIELWLSVADHRFNDRRGT